MDLCHVAHSARGCYVWRSCSQRQMQTPLMSLISIKDGGLFEARAISMRESHIEVKIEE